MHRNFKPRRLALALALAFAHLASVQAQTTPANPPTTSDDELKLDSVVITGSTASTSKMKTSLSVSTLGSEQLEQLSVTNAAEVLRAVPGVRSESSGGEGNANITVRGVPISAGGARYVQLQEDGLPILMFGDIAFGTADQFLRVDANVDHLEVVRGGSASTLATNSPGGIINFISRNGEDSGGSVALGLGLDYRQERVDFEYGGKLGASTRFHVGGFFRQGQADGRNANFTAQKGGQLKANLTQDLGAGNYVSVNFKALDDRTPTLLPVPVNTVNGTINAIPGVDPRKAFFITGSFPADTTLAHDGSFVTSDPRDGLHVKSTAFGVEAGFNLAGWRIEERFRTASNSGRFMGLFPSNNGNAGQPGTFNGVLFNTSLDGLDNTFNDLKVSRTIALGGADKLVLTGGLFYGKQQVAQTWYWNSYDMTLSGNHPTILGQATNGTTQWGGCCVRTWDVDYTTVAPYAALSWEAGPVNLDASLRRDQQKASGYTLEDVGTSPGAWDPVSRKTVNYKVSHTSYSFGANYTIDRNLALFARYSDGVSFSADRLLYGNPLDGSTPINLNEVKQFEAGVKWRSGPLSAFVTLFNARTAESNYEVTTQLATSNRYRANGVELETGWRAGAFKLNGGLTLTDATITGSADGTNLGKTPRRQAKVLWQLRPTYSIGAVQLGASVIGTSKSWGDDGNTITLPGYTSVNAFVTYQFSNALTLALSANNLFNTIGYTEVEGDGHAARSINGRSVRASVRYSF
jgi:outer membrane receptor protein involved in Fe transport